MEIALVAVTMLVLAIFGYVGHRRDTRRAALAMGGTLIGAVLADLWALRWSTTVARWFGAGQAASLVPSVSIATLLLTMLVIGYGGGLLLGGAEKAPPLWRRVLNALLGMLNGALALGLTVGYLAAGNAGFAEEIGTMAIGQLLLDAPRWIVLGFSLLASGAVLVRGLMSLAGSGRRAAAPTAGPSEPAARPAAAPGAVPAAGTPRTREEMASKVLEKIDERQRR